MINPDVLIALVFIVCGYILILLEILIVPGVVTGVIGFGLVVTGIVYSYLHYGSSGAGIALTGSLIVGAALVYLMVKLKVWNRFVLQSSERADEGFVSPDSGLSELVGKEGTAFTALRPSGEVKIDGCKYDAITQGGFVEKNTDIVVIALSGQQLVVTQKSQ